MGASRNLYVAFPLTDGAERKYMHGYEAAAEYLKNNPGWRIEFRLMDSWIWRTAEQYSLENGEYEPLPILFGDIIRRNDTLRTLTLLHFPHRSPDGTKVRFIASHEDGVLGKHTELLPGRYLQRYAKSILTPEQIRDAANRFTIDLMGNLVLKRGKERTDFRFAYENQDLKSPSSDYRSCMSYGVDYYASSPSDIHPAEIFAAGDLEIFYLVSEADPNRVLARTIGYPAKKVFSKIYSANHKFYTVLRDKMMALGFKSDPDKFSGASLLKISFKNRFNYLFYVMPYIDGEIKVRMGADNFVIVDANERGQNVFDPDSTDGTLDPEMDSDYQEDDDYSDEDNEY